MQDVLSDYLVKKVWEDIRNEKPFDENLSNALNQFPLIEKLRSEATDSDIPLLMAKAKNGGKDFGITVSLLKKYSQTPEIRKLLLSLWRDLPDYYFRRNLIWRILDEEIVEKNIENELYEFVRNNYDIFLKENLAWWGGADQVLPAIKSRISDKSVPQTKYWIYICLLAGSSDKAAAREFVSAYANRDDFLGQVARDLLGRFDKSQ